MKDKIGLNIGCGNRNFGDNWFNLDKEKYAHVSFDDSKHIPLLPNFVDVIYSSHMLEYIDRNEVRDYLKEWNRVLKPNGTLYLSVPDFRKLSELYLNENVPLYNLVGPLYGKMNADGENIYHKTVWDYQSLGEHLHNAGFRRIEKWDHSELEDLIGKEYDDHSKAKLNGQLISLNIKCRK